MFCKHCGAQIPDGSETCPSCGGSLKAAAPAPTASSQPAFNASSVKDMAGGLADTALEKTAGLPRALIAKVCVLIALVAFFLPFISVSCSYQGEKVEESYSGFRLMFSIDKDDDEVAENAESDPKPNVFLMIAFAGGIATAVFLFVKKNNKLAAIISCVSVVALLIFRMSFTGYYDIPDEMAKHVDIDAKFGLILSILMFIVTAAASFLEHKSESSGGGSSSL